MEYTTKKVILVCYYYIMASSMMAQQKTISITIDDIPNTAQYYKDNFSAVLLNVLDSLDIPFSIFINEGKVGHNPYVNKNKELLQQWVASEKASLGNHSYSHSRYSDVGYESFVMDIEKGNVLTEEYASENNKEVNYFRFPYNDMGKDQTQHFQIKDYLKASQYSLAPFTVESSDWMFNHVYQYYLEKGETDKAAAIGKMYVSKTLEMVKFYEEMADSLYNRPVKQIYLCHDNALNARYLVEVIRGLKEAGYEIVNFEESLSDPVYQQKDHYYKKWGISWFYRWMDTQEERLAWMKREPDMSTIENTYNSLLAK